MSVLHAGEQLAGSVVVEVSGHVDSSNASELREALRRVDDQDAVVIDLRCVPFMDSAGLGALICGIRELRIRGGRAALCTRPGAVHRLLHVTGLDRIVPVAESLEDARASLAAAGGGLTT